MTKIIRRSLVICLFISPVIIQASQNLSVAFRELLSESGLSYRIPEQYRVLSANQDPVLSYEHAIRHDNNELEIRYSVRPVNRIRIDYQDPHNAAPEPNHLFNMLFSSLVDQFSNGSDAPRREYDASQAKQLFNADWAAAAVFDVNQDYSKDYTQGLIVAIHKNDKADAYMVYLFNSYSDVKSLITTALPALRFDD